MKIWTFYSCSNHRNKQYFLYQNIFESAYDKCSLFCTFNIQLYDLRQKSRLRTFGALTSKLAVLSKIQYLRSVVYVSYWCKYVMTSQIRGHNHSPLMKLLIVCLAVMSFQMQWYENFTIALIFSCCMMLISNRQLCIFCRFNVLRVCWTAVLMC